MWLWKEMQKTEVCHKPATRQKTRERKRDGLTSITMSVLVNSKQSSVPRQRTRFKRIVGALCLNYIINHDCSTTTTTTTTTTITTNTLGRLWRRCCHVLQSQCSTTTTTTTTATTNITHTLGRTLEAINIEWIRLSLTLMDFLSRRRDDDVPGASTLLPVLAASRDAELDGWVADAGSLTLTTSVSELLASDSCGLLPLMPFRSLLSARYCNRQDDRYNSR